MSIEKEKSPKLSFFVIPANDIGKSRDFQRDLLRIGFVQEQHGKGPVHYSFQLDGGVTMEIYPGNPGDKPPRLGFDVPSIEEPSKMLAEKGILPRHPIINSKGGRSVTFSDPDGRVVELREIITGS